MVEMYLNVNILRDPYVEDISFEDGDYSKIIKYRYSELLFAS